ncbi:DUF1801 domain-containing protein [Nocardia sp. GCM10030253]|uniref:DUF1801 domain-containing protein n=1 Tax=Nocardia sp. GCM10030253 TaxID=3273404 RepID=UPI0036251E79
MSLDSTALDDYLARTGAREPELRALDAVVRSSAPSFEPVLTEGMGTSLLGYGLMPYQTKSMKEPSEWPVVALAARKNYVSLYISAVQDGEYVAVRYADRLGKVDVGKSCIRFKRLDDLNLDTVREILADLERRSLAGEKLYG